MKTFLAVLICLGASQAPETTSSWQQVHEDGTLKVWARDRDGTAVREVRAEKIIDAPPRRVWEVLGDVDHYAEFMPYVVEARIVAAARDKVIEYYRIDPPLVNARDYTLQSSIVEDHPKGRYVRRWQAANHHGPARRQDSIRLDLVDGSWTVQRHGDGSQSHVTYWVFTDPAGKIPAFVANRANTSSLPDLFSAVQRRAQDPAWHR